MGIGERIAEERKRLGLSQSAFAERVGVSFSSQRRYEKGERDPDSGYLVALAKIGVDVGYLLSGVRITRELNIENRAYLAALYRLADALQINLEEFDDLLSQEEWATYYALSGQAPEGVERFSDHATSVVKRWVENAATINSELLADILRSLEVAADRSGVVLSQEKKAQAVAMLYRAFKASGEVDQAMIDEAVRLASA